MANETCVFCKILKGQLPGSFVYKGECCSAFMDIHPISDGHLLVIPNRHVERFADLTEDEAGDLFSTGQKILKAIQKSDVRCDGANLFLSDGSVAGQEVDHSHLHIVPRFNGDGQKIGFKHASSISKERLDAIASSIGGKL